MTSNTKRVLILVLSTDLPDVQGNGPQFHYRNLMETSRKTWDAEEVEGVETIFYFGKSEKANAEKELYTGVPDEFWNMGYKTIAAFEYALANRQFNYIFRANASLYVNKERLLRYAQDKPETNLALGVCAPTSHEGSSFDYMWGPGYMLSRDVVQAVVDNKEKWVHTMTDDLALSHLLHAIGIPLDNRGSLCSVALGPFPGYNFVYYENGQGGACSMTDLKELNRMLPNQFGIRVKDDADRTNDIRLMKELHTAFTA